MPKFIEISPLPAGITKAKVRQIFEPFVTEDIFVKGNKAFLKFSDPNDVDSLYMKYDDDAIPELQMAKIIALPDNYDGSDLDHSQPLEQKMKVENFILQQKSQPKSKQLQPVFIVVTQCDFLALQRISEEAIRQRVFGKFKIGRVIKYNRDLFVQFSDPYQIQLLQVSFPGRLVTQLGPTATIDLTDPNFSYEVVKKQVQKYEREKKIQQAQRKQRQRRQAAQLEETKRRLSREAQSNRFSSQTRWTIRPEDQLAQMVRINTQNKNPQLFWTLIVVIWGIYVMFV